MPRNLKVYCCLGVFCLLLGGSQAGWGADWVVLPGIELKGEYLNNINNSPRIKQSDYILSVGPNLSLSYNSETSKLEGKLALLGMHYLHHDNLDRINQYYYINGAHKATPRLSLKLGSSYITDSTSTAELEASGVVIGRRLRTAVKAAPGFSYLLTERLSTSLEYGFTMVDYQEIFYQNYKGQSVIHGFDYLLNERTTLLSRVTGTYYKYDNTDNTIMAVGPQIGLNHKYEEKWDFMFLGGVNISRIKSNVGVFAADTQTGFLTVQEREQTVRSVAPFFSVTAGYRWETGNLNLSYERRQSANAYGNQSQYNTFFITTRQAITEKLDFNLKPYFYTSMIDNPGSDFNSMYYGIQPGLTYRLTERTKIGAYYNFAYRSATGSGSYRYPINNVWVSLNYEYPLHY